jgi:chitin synthase
MVTNDSFRNDSNRFSMVSTSDSISPSGGFDSASLDSANVSGATRQRYDSNAVLMLPAPLSVNVSAPSAASTIPSRSSEENGYFSDGNSGSHQGLIPSPPSGDSPFSPYEPLPSPLFPSTYEGQVSRSAGSTPVQRTPVPNPFRNSLLNGFEDSQSGLVAEPEEMSAASPVSTPRARGVSLADNGPVPGPDGVRRVSRSTGRRPTSQQPPQNRYSRGSTYLPPGAAPPQANPGGGM